MTILEALKDRKIMIRNWGDSRYLSWADNFIVRERDNEGLLIKIHETPDESEAVRVLLEGKPMRRSYD